MDKSEQKHDVTAYMSGSMILRDSFSNRILDLNDIFDIVLIDDVNHYIIKELDVTEYNWFRYKPLNKAYRYNAIHMHFNFNTNKLPIRCEVVYQELLEDVTDHLKTTRSRLNKTQVKCTLIHLMKHISRMYYHKNCHITYTRQRQHWNVDKTLSHSYMMDIIDYLENKGMVKSYTGYQNDKQVTSLLTVRPDFIKYCNGGDPPTKMDSCLRCDKDKPTIKIHIEDNKGNKKPRSIRRGEKIVADKISDVVKAYNEFLSDSHIMVNGIAVPELFFARVYNSDLDHGGRFYDDGTVQGQDSKSRSTILIDGMKTVELDYKSLHYSMAAEELGIDITHKDPYNFDYEIEVDQKAINSWREQVGYQGKYDPVRNLKKTAILTMFNADSYISASRGISNAILKDYKKEDLSKRKFVGLKNIKVKELIKQVQEHNHEVSEYFLSGVGIRFQNLDSKMIEYCVKSFMDINQVCIPVHDSLVVKEVMNKYTVKIMHDAYGSVMGSNINCRVE